MTTITPITMPAIAPLETEEEDCIGGALSREGCAVLDDRVEDVANVEADTAAPEVDGRVVEEVAEVEVEVDVAVSIGEIDVNCVVLVILPALKLISSDQCAPRSSAFIAGIVESGGNPNNGTLSSSPFVILHVPSDHWLTFHCIPNTPDAGSICGSDRSSSLTPSCQSEP